MANHWRNRMNGAKPQAFSSPNPPKKHTNGFPSHLCCTSSSHEYGGYKWRYENRESFRQHVTGREEMAGQSMMILIGVSLWMTCSAAPTECHFNSKGRINLFITQMHHFTTLQCAVRIGIVFIPVFTFITFFTAIKKADNVFSFYCIIFYKDK